MGGAFCLLSANALSLVRPQKQRYGRLMGCTAALAVRRVGGGLACDGELKRSSITTTAC